MVDLGTVTVGGGAKRPSLIETVAQPAKVEETPAEALKTKEQVFHLVNEVSKDVFAFTIPPTKKYPQGRKVKVKEPEGSVQLKAALMLPQGVAGNGMVLSLVQAALYVIEIDGRKNPPPTTFLQAQSIIDDLGDEGNMALQLALEEAFPISPELREAGKRAAQLRSL